MAHTQPITAASLLQVAQVAAPGKTAQPAGKGPLDDVDLAALVRDGRVQFVDAQGQIIPPGQEEAIARSILSAVVAKTGKAVTQADVAELTAALQAAAASKFSTPAAQMPPAKGKSKADGAANQEFLAALVGQMVQVQATATDKTKAVAHAGVISVCLSNLPSSTPAAAAQTAFTLAAPVQTALTPVKMIDPATGKVTLTGTNQPDQTAAATVAKVAQQAQAIVAQSEAASTAPDAAAQSGGTAANTALTQDSVAAALVQAEQTVATKAATVAAAKRGATEGAADGKAALPANPLGIVLPSVAGAGKVAVSKSPSVTKAASSAAPTHTAAGKTAAPTDTPAGQAAKPAQRSAGKTSNPRLAAAVAGNSLHHDLTMASALAGQGSATGASIIQGAQSAVAAGAASGANLAMPAALAEQIARQLPLDGAMPGLITIHLNPPELGRLQLTFENDSNGGVAAVIRVENPDTLAQLRQEMPSVMEKINESGVNLKRVEVTLSGQQGNATDSPGREGMWQQARQEQPLRWGAYEEDSPAPEAAAATARSAGWTGGAGLNVWM